MTVRDFESFRLNFVVEKLGITDAGKIHGCLNDIEQFKKECFNASNKCDMTNFATEMINSHDVEKMNSQDHYDAKAIDK